MPEQVDQQEGLGEFEQIGTQLFGFANAVSAVRDHVGRGPGARELAIAVTNLEQAALWVGHAQAIRESAGEDGTLTEESH